MDGNSAVASASGARAETSCPFALIAPRTRREKTARAAERQISQVRRRHRRRHAPDVGDLVGQRRERREAFGRRVLPETRAAVVDRRRQRRASRRRRRGRDVDQDAPRVRGLVGARLAEFGTGRPRAPLHQSAEGRAVRAVLRDITQGAAGPRSRFRGAEARRGGGRGGRVRRVVRLVVAERRRLPRRPGPAPARRISFARRLRNAAKSIPRDGRFGRRSRPRARAPCASRLAHFDGARRRPTTASGRLSRRRLPSAALREKGRALSLRSRRQSRASRSYRRPRSAGGGASARRRRPWPPKTRTSGTTRAKFR